ISKHIGEVPSSVSDDVPEVPPALDALVARLLSKEPRSRGDSAAEIASELERIATGAGKTSRGPVIGAAAAFVVLVVVGGTMPKLALTPEPAPSPGASASASPRSSPRVASSPTSTPRPTPSPAWVVELPEPKRPRFPLPSGIVASKTPGEYVAK